LTNIDDYPDLAMDTEFPGSWCGPWDVQEQRRVPLPDAAHERGHAEAHPVGLTSTDADGMLPTFGGDEYCVWQFNFKEFSLREDMYAQDSSTC